MNPLLEHAARILDHQPTHSMGADSLYRRARHESGVDMPYTRFLEGLRERSRDFVVITPDRSLAPVPSWDVRQRARYEAVLDAAGLREPLVVRTQDDMDPEDGGAVRKTGIVGDVHASLTCLLRSCDHDDPLRADVETALDGLRLLERVVRS